MNQDKGEAYLLRRNPEESARLNSQHGLVLELTGNTPVHPSIPTDKIHDVADVATGTGIWLQDVASILTAQNPHPSRPYYLHGFDISGVQFQPIPTGQSAEIHLSEQNCLEPFPAEHHGRYDFVHMRFLAGALKTDEFGTAVRNLFDMLKPGGYFQWDEGDITSFHTTTTPQPRVVAEIVLMMTDTLARIGLCATAPAQIEAEAHRAGFIQVRRDRYDTRDKPPRVKDAACSWFVQSAWSTISSSMLKSGRARDEADAKEITRRMLAEFELSGAVPLVNVQVLVGRKPGGEGGGLNLTRRKDVDQTLSCYRTSRGSE